MPRRPGDPDRPLLYPHLGEPAGLSQRSAAEWRRANTYYIRYREPISLEVVDDPPDCFTPEEWQDYARLVSHSEGYRLPNSPYLANRETPAEIAARQRRGLRTAACDDCTLAYQRHMGRLGLCEPLRYEVTPDGKRQQLLDQEFTEGPIDGAAHRQATGSDYVLRQEGVPHRETGEAGRARRP